MLHGAEATVSQSAEHTAHAAVMVKIYEYI